MIRVGKCIYAKNGMPIYPSFQNFTSIIVMMKSHSKYHFMSPYELTDEKGRIMENCWQFSKVYNQVPKTKEYYSRYDNTVIWEHNEEVHIDENDNINNLYRNWRKKGMDNKYPVRYPVSFQHRDKCLYALIELDNGTIDETNKLDYIQARKKIYLPLYCELVKKEPEFVNLKKRLEKGENLLIIEVDGPCQQSLNYYKNNYGVDDTFIENNTMLVNQQNINIMLNDSKHPFGHGYCLAISLLGKDKEWAN